MLDRRTLALPCPLCLSFPRLRSLSQTKGLVSYVPLISCSFMPQGPVCLRATHKCCGAHFRGVNTDPVHSAPSCPCACSSAVSGQGSGGTAPCETHPSGAETCIACQTFIVEHQTLYRCWHLQWLIIKQGCVLCKCYCSKPSTATIKLGLFGSHLGPNPGLHLGKGPYFL